jgi:hypothetical protein
MGSAAAHANGRRLRAFEADVRTIARLREKLGIDESSKQSVTDVSFKTPQTLRLGGREAKTWHLDELTLNALEHLIDTHEPGPPGENHDKACVTGVPYSSNARTRLHGPSVAVVNSSLKSRNSRTCSMDGAGRRDER